MLCFNLFLWIWLSDCLPVTNTPIDDIKANGNNWNSVSLYQYVNNNDSNNVNVIKKFMLAFANLSEIDICVDVYQTVL